MLKRLTWYARRLAVMERGEIRHRVREQVRRRAARRGSGSWNGHLVAGRTIARPALFDALFEADLPPGIAAQIEEAARAFKSGRLFLLNREWPRSILDEAGRVAPQTWFLDPVTGGAWPDAERYTFDIDFRFERGLGDVKYTAEANRLQFLVAPAVHARRAGDDTLARAVLESVLGWMEANPPGRGLNWHSGIELALRLAALAVIAAALEPWTDAATGERLAAMAAAHGEWIALFPSLYSSANNHLVAEAVGLVLAAQLVPAHPDAADWQARGIAHLEERALALFFADGVCKEQSPTYGAFTLEMLALGFAASGGPPPVVAERLAAAAEALNAVLDESGLAPRIGDDDEGRVFTTGAPEPRYVASITAAVAGLLGRPDLAPALRDPHWRDIVFASPSAGPEPRDGVTTFSEGGYTVRRGKIAGRHTHLVFDHGPLGFGAIAAHGHADALSVWLSLDGRPALVDAGTHLYHGAGGNRRRFRVSAVHNTLTIDGASQSQPSGPFNWMPRRAQARLSLAGGTVPLTVAASHDGYARRFGTVHHREIAETRDGFDITDRLDGAPRADFVEIAFLLAPELQAEIADGSVTAHRDLRPELVIRAPAGAEIALVRADTASGRGWHSPGFGLLEEAATIVFRLAPDTGPWRSSIIVGP